MVGEKVSSRGELRRQAMVDAATDLFLEKGFERTSLSDIVSRSKGSRSTLYELFGNKEGLLRAMIEEVTTEIWTVLRAEDGEGDMLGEEALVDLGRRFVSAALAPRGIALFRILANEGHRLPEIAEFFFERGPRTAERLLADRFRAAPRRPGMDATPEQLGQMFLGMVLGVYHVHRVMGLPAVDDAVIDAHVRVAVRVFMDGAGLART